MSTNQALQWRSRYFKPAVKAIAESRTDLADLATATPYSLRRGGISARLRGENAQSVAEQCGTSLEMLSRHYSYEIDDHATRGRSSAPGRRTILTRERPTGTDTGCGPIRGPGSKSLPGFGFGHLRLASRSQLLRDQLRFGR
jgi:hypothetical protein